MYSFRFSVDHQPFVDIVLPYKSNYIPLGNNLKGSSHSLVLYLKNSIQAVDRWLYGPINRLCVLGLVLDTNGYTLPHPLYGKRTMVFWDSIGEGVNDVGTSGGDLVNNDSTETWGIALAEALDSEVSMVAFGAQGYSVGGNGNTPPIFTPGNDASTAWNKFDAVHSRLDQNGHLDPQPDYIFCGHGTNDFLRNANLEGVVISIEGWLSSQRRAAPHSIIFVVIPFGGFLDQNITSAFRQYQKRTKDSNVFLIDMPNGRMGLDKPWGPTLFSGDGVHPLAFRDGQLGAMLAVHATKSLFEANIFLDERKND